ncbi:MAG TPA: hypothetical protein VEI54_02305 [Candidatus Limnocylindrales bacterium]|nr:hypothetical protein [Candidatus Limnocylindrales bacterium]
MALLNRSVRGSLSLRVLGAALALVSLLLWGGCKKVLQGDDPQLKPIQEMLESNVPAGTPESVVNQFLSTRGYPVEPEHKPGTLVAIIRHIDTEKLEPVTARVTFYFDANGKLNATEIVRTANQPIAQ